MGPIPAREYLRIEHPSRIWITRSDNTVVKMQAPKVLGDTLVGYVNGEFQEIQLSQTKMVQAKRPQSGRTALAIAVGVVGVVVAAKLVTGSGSVCTMWNGQLGYYVPCYHQDSLSHP
jgi:hypothetical protein